MRDPPSQVGQFYMALFEEIDQELQTRTVTVRGQSTPASAAAASEGASSALRLVAWDRDMDVERLHIIVPIMAQALRTMQELCQGPCRANQV